MSRLKLSIFLQERQQAGGGRTPDPTSPKPTPATPTTVKDRQNTDAAPPKDKEPTVPAPVEEEAVSEAEGKFNR